MYVKLLEPQTEADIEKFFLWNNYMKKFVGRIVKVESLTDLDDDYYDVCIDGRYWAWHKDFIKKTSYYEPCTSNLKKGDTLRITDHRYCACWVDYMDKYVGSEFVLGDKDLVLGTDGIWISAFGWLWKLDWVERKVENEV